MAPTVIELDQDEVLDVLGSGTGTAPEWEPATAEPEPEPALPPSDGTPPDEGARADDVPAEDLEPTIFSLAGDPGAQGAHGAHFASTGRRRSLEEWRPGATRSGGEPLPLLMKLALAGGALVLLAGVAVVVLGTGGTEQHPRASTTSAPATTATTLSGGFVAYTDPSGRFRAELPAPPGIQHSQSDLGPQDAYVATTTNGSSVKILVTRLPDGDWSHNDQKLRDALTATARSEGGTVRSSIVGTRAGRRELNGRVTTPGGAIDARFFAVGNDLYGIVVASKSPDGDPTLFGRVTDRLLVP